MLNSQFPALRTTIFAFWVAPSTKNSNGKVIVSKDCLPVTESFIPTSIPLLTGRNPVALVIPGLEERVLVIASSTVWIAAGSEIPMAARAASGAVVYSHPLSYVYGIDSTYMMAEPPWLSIPLIERVFVLI